MGEAVIEPVQSSPYAVSTAVAEPTVDIRGVQTPASVISARYADGLQDVMRARTARLVNTLAARAQRPDIAEAWTRLDQREDHLSAHLYGSEVDREVVARALDRTNLVRQQLAGDLRGTLGLADDFVIDLREGFAAKTARTAERGRSTMVHGVDLGLGSPALS